MNCDEIVFRKISDLTLLENNPRKISKKDLDRLVDSCLLYTSSRLYGELAQMTKY